MRTGNTDKIEILFRRFILGGKELGVIKRETFLTTAVIVVVAAVHWFAYQRVYVWLGSDFLNG